eukprot:136505-Pelagomonas_calceolata.AAC.1
MPVVHCGGRLWCRYHLCWPVVVPLRVSMNADGGVELFIELDINEATYVGVVDAAIEIKKKGKTRTQRKRSLYQ